ncbi:ALP1-like protein [Tanacetum coccineum]
MIYFIHFLYRDDEDEVNSELVMFTEACQAAYEASKPKVQRTPVERDRYGAHDRLVMAYFSEHPQYDEATFRDHFRMSRRLFTKIVHEANCLVAYIAQFSKGDNGPNPFILLEAIASNDLWILHAFFGVSGMNNDVNVLRQYPIFNDLKSGRAPDTKHEAARKDVERAFGVLKLKWKLIKYPARGMSRKEQHRDDDPIRTHEESMQVTQEIVDRTAPLRLKADLVEHIWHNAN